MFSFSIPVPSLDFSHSPSAFWIVVIVVIIVVTIVRTAHKLGWRRADKIKEDEEMAFVTTMTCEESGERGKGFPWMARRRHQARIEAEEDMQDEEDSKFN